MAVVPVPAKAGGAVAAVGNAVTRGLSAAATGAQQRGVATGQGTGATPASRGVFQTGPGAYVFYSGGDPASAASYSHFAGDPSTVAQVSRPAGFSHSGYGVAPVPGAAAPAAGGGAAAPVSDAADTPIEDSSYFGSYMTALQQAQANAAPMLAQYNALTGNAAGNSNVDLHATLGGAGATAYQADLGNLQQQQVAARLQGRQGLAQSGGFWTGQRDQYEANTNTSDTAAQTALNSKEGQSALDSILAQYQGQLNTVSPLMQALQTAYGSRLSGITLPTMSGLGVGS